MNYTFVQRHKVDGPDPDRLNDQCDRVMEALVDLGVADPWIGGAMATGDVQIGVMVDAESYVAAVENAMALIRTAISMPGIAMPGWPQHDDSAVRSIEVAVVTADALTGSAVPF